MRRRPGRSEREEAASSGKARQGGGAIKKVAPAVAKFARKRRAEQAKERRRIKRAEQAKEKKKEG